MGEAKRRKTALGEKYGQEAQIFPIRKKTAQQFVSGAIAVLGLVSALVVSCNSSVPWPVFGWWQVN